MKISFFILLACFSLFKLGTFSLPTESEKGSNSYRSTINDLISHINENLRTSDSAFSTSNNEDYQIVRLPLDAINPDISYYIVKHPGLILGQKNLSKLTLAIDYKGKYFNIATYEDSIKKFIRKNEWPLSVMDSSYLIHSIIYPRKEERIEPKNWKEISSDSISLVQSIRINQYRFDDTIAEKRLCLVNYFTLWSSSIEELQIVIDSIEISSGKVGNWEKVYKPCTSRNIAIKRPELCN